MSLAKSSLNAVPQRNQDLIFGYVKECEKKNKANIPNMIKYLCLIFFNVDRDEFDSNHKHQSVKINDNYIVYGGEKNHAQYLNCYLQNIANTGIHIWKFQCDSAFMFDRIGLRNVETESLPLSGYFDMGQDQKTVVGYGYSLCGQMRNCFGIGTYFNAPCKDADLIQMRLDCNKWTLEFKINDSIWRKGYDVLAGKYKAVVAVYGTNTSRKYTLVSYQCTV